MLSCGGASPTAIGGFEYGTGVGTTAMEYSFVGGELTAPGSTS